MKHSKRLRLFYSVLWYGLIFYGLTSMTAWLIGHPFMETPVEKRGAYLLTWIWGGISSWVFSEIHQGGRQGIRDDVIDAILGQ